MHLGVWMHKDGTFVPGELKRVQKLAQHGCGGVIIGESTIDAVWADRWNINDQDMNEPLWAFLSNVETDFSDTYGPKKNAWRTVARTLHEGGSLALAQLFHAGNMRVGCGSVKGPVGVGPMGYTRKTGEVIKAADEDDMQQICDSFARAAAYFKDAGFDGVMVHGGHGWLITQFLSERCNQRTDNYGGSMEKRCNFPVRIMKSIRQAVGDDFVLEVRVSGEETGVPGGYKVDQVGVFSQMVEGIVDIMHISNGHYRLHGTGRMGGGTVYDAHNCNLEQGIYVKEHTKNMLVNVVGGINNPEDSDRLIGEGKIDFISIAKQTFADPRFGRKCMTGQAEDIQRCVRCIYCAGGGREKEGWLESGEWQWDEVPGHGRPIEKDEVEEKAPYDQEGICTVNPTHGLKEPEGGWPEVKKARKVLVIGGGVAGMMAAITATDRGHCVTVVEKSDKLGGILNFTDYDNYKVDLNNYKNLLVRRMQNRHINVLFNTEANADLIAREAPDVIITAVGATVKIPDFPGIENTVHALDVYTPDFKAGDNVVIIGGGLHACETAIHLADTAKSVTVLKFKSPDFHDGAPVPATRQKINSMAINYQTDQVLKGIKKDAVEVDGAVYPADTIVYCVGMNPRAEAVAAINSFAGDTPVKVVGDCNKASDVAHATRAAYVTAMEIA